MVHTQLPSETREAFVDSLEGCQTQRPLFSAPPSSLGGADTAAPHLRHFSETLVSVAALSIYAVVGVVSPDSIAVCGSL